MRLGNRRKGYPQVIEPWWLELAFFCSACSMFCGFGLAFLIDGMEPAALLGTIPAFVTLIAKGVAR